MTFYTLTRTDGPGPWDYPTLGFTAVNGAVLDGSLFTPPLTDPPDVFWAVGGAAESGITRWGALISPPAPAEPASGSVLVYDAVANASEWVEGDELYAPGTSLGDALLAMIQADIAATDADAGSSFRVQQDARHADTYASQLTALGVGDETARLTSWLALPSPIGVKRLVGSFTVSDRVVVPSGTNLDGSSATITQTGDNKITLDADASSNVTIRGVTLVGKATDYTGGSPVSMGIRIRGGSNNRVIDCTTTGHAGVGVKLENCTESVVRGCRVVGTSPPSFDKDQYGVLFEGTCERVRAEGNIISAVAQGIIASMATAGIQVVHNMIYNVTGQHGIYLQNGTDTLIAGNWVSGTAYQGMKVQMTSSSPSDGEGMNIIGNHVDSAVSHGILLDNTDPAPTYFFKAVNISGNTVTSCGEDALSINDVSGAVIANNVIRGGRAGMSIANSDALLVHGNRIATTTAEGIKLDKVSGSEIVRNRIVNPASANNGTTEHGIRVTTFTTVCDLIFDDNQISDNLGNMRYGIYVESGADQATISFRRNRVTGATDYGIRLIAATPVREWFGNDVSGSLGRVLNLPTTGAGDLARQEFGTAAPTTGTYARGDKVWNTAPAASGTIGWVCTAAGTPGTWKTFGAISA